MFKKSFVYLLMAVLLVTPMLLTACGGGAKAVAFAVVLPTKNEPRWIQDEGIFINAFKAQNIKVQILWSDGDSAKEKANIESLITQKVKAIIICPVDGRSR